MPERGDKATVRADDLNALRKALNTWGDSSGDVRDAARTLIGHAEYGVTR